MNSDVLNVTIAIPESGWTIQNYLSNAKSVQITKGMKRIFHIA